MEIVAKVYCANIEAQPQYGQQLVTFHAVTNEAPENESFAKATPSLNLQMWVGNETKAAEFFEPGKEYFLTFQKS